MRLRDDDGFGLIELLIAMTILVIGILAIVAGFSSGMLALQRASRASTAATIADKKMEQYRRVPFGAVIPFGTNTVSPDPIGPDGRAYWMSTTIAWKCPLDGTTSTTASPRLVCAPVGGVESRSVKLVSIEVRDGSPSAKVLVRESSVFDESTG